MSSRFLLCYALGLSFWGGLTGSSAVASPVAGEPQHTAPTAPTPPDTTREVTGGTRRLAQAVLDTLQQRLGHHLQPDSVRVNRLNALALALRTNNPARAAALFREALALATRLGYNLGQGNAQFGLGYYYRDQNQYDSALAYTQRAHQHYRRLHDDYNQVRALYGMARIYFEQGLYGQAMARGLEGLHLARTRRNPRGELFTLTQLGQTSTALGEYGQARSYLEQAYRLAHQLHDPIGSGHAYTALGELSEQQQRWAQAQQFYERALTSYQPVYNAQGLLPTRIRLLAMAKRQGRAQQALTDGRALLPLAATANAQSHLHLVLARAWRQLGRPDSAAHHGAQSLRISRGRGLREISRDAAQLLAQVASQRQQFAEAYRYQQLASAYTDSLTGNTTRRLVAALQFRAEQAQARSQRRERAQQLQLVRLRQQQQLALGAGLMVLLAMLAGLGVRQYRRQQATREQELRTRLATDLHNDVGTLLQQISQQSGLLQEGLADGEAQRRHLDQLSEASRSAVRQLNDVVWSLDAHNDQLGHLLSRLRDYAHEVLDPAGLALSFTFPTDQLAQPLPQLLRRNLYLIFKESLQNVLAHAPEATAVQVSVQFLPGTPAQVALEVRDNGGGVSNQSKRRSGPGSVTIAARAQALGGLSYSGHTAEGFRVYVVAPLAGGWNVAKRYRQE